MKQVSEVHHSASEHSIKITRETVTVKASLNGCKQNVVMDTGAGPSLIDYGSLEHINLQHKIRKLRDDDDGIINASGHEMDILGVVDILVGMLLLLLLLLLWQLLPDLESSKIRVW